MSKIRLALLFGGVSGEHDVSCLSAASILKHLNPERYDVVPVGITKQGRWYVQPAWTGQPLSVQEHPAREVTLRPGRGLEVGGTPLPLDVVFPINHGVLGEDGRLQGLLEWAGVPYAGAGVLGSALGMDKVFAKLIWSNLGLPVVPSASLRTHEVKSAADRTGAYHRLVASLGSPLFVKPANSGSSVGVTKVTSVEQWGAALDLALTVDAKVLVETAVSAREVEVAVLGGLDPRAYGPGEVVPSHEFYDYDAKYLDPNGAELRIPADLPADVSQRILALAVEAYRALDVKGFARVDFFVEKNGPGVWINEINTLPGFTTISMFPRMAMTGGMTYAEVLDAIVDQALA